MPPATDVAGLAGEALFLAALVVFLPGVRALGRRSLGALLMGVLAASSWPLLPLPLAAYARAVTGDLSITTIALVLRYLVGRFFSWGPMDERSRVFIAFLLAVAGLVLYPLALGLGPHDPYSLGFGNPFFLGALLLLSLAALVRGLVVVALGIGLSVLAWAGGLYESTNLWDYLLDPFAFAYGLLATLGHCGRWARREGRLGGFSGRGAPEERSP